MAKLAPQVPESTKPEAANAPPKTKLAPKFSKKTNLPTPNQEQVRTDSYDQGYVEAYGNRADYRAESQNSWQMWRNALTQGTGEAVLGALEGVGYLGDLEQWGNIITGSEKEFGNWFSDLMKEGKEEIAEAAPVNQTSEAQGNFAPWDPTWWAGNTPSIFSALSLLIPTTGVVKGVGALGKAMGAGSKFMTSKGGQTLAKGLTGALASRYMENTMEASDTYKQTYNLALQEGASEDDATATAADAASKAWYANLANLGTDIMQYTMLAGGFKGLKGMTAFAATMGGESLEEAGQAVISQEAINSALTKTDFFGTGFSDRLLDYAQTPELKTGAIFGALGGGIFHAAGKAGERLFKPSYQKLAEEGLAKKRAEATGDIESLQKLKDISFTRLALDHLQFNKTDELRQDLENLKNEEGLDSDTRSGIDKQIKNLDFLETQYQKLAGNKNMPIELVLPVLAAQLDHKLTAEQLQDLNRKTEKQVADVIQNGEIQGGFKSAKDLYHSSTAYDLLASKTGKDFGAIRKSLNAMLMQEMKNFQADPSNKDKSFYEQIVSSSDAAIQDSFNKLVAQQERYNLVKEDLAKLSSIEGIEEFKEFQKQKTIDTRVAAKLAEGNLTIPELKAAFNIVKDPMLKQTLAANLKQAEEAQQAGNKEKTKAAVEKVTKKQVEKDKVEIKQDRLDVKETPLDVKEQPIDIADDLDAVFGPPSNPFDVVTGIEAIDVPEGMQVDTLTTDETGELVVQRLEVEKPGEEVTPIETVTAAQEEQAASIEGLKENSAKTVLKEIAGKYETINGKEVFIIEQNPDTTPKRQEYFYAEDTAHNNPVAVTKVFDATDETILTVNTPLVSIGDEVIIKIEPNWPFWKTTDRESVVMNIYRTDKNGKLIGKPLTQIPSSKNKKTSTEASRRLRNLVNDSGSQIVRTKITYKNFGDLLALRNEDGTRLQNSLAVLESDMVQTENGWQVAKTPYNPILAYVNSSSLVTTPAVETMQGVDRTVLDRLAKMDPITRAMPGTAMVLRTTPAGGFGFAQIDPRTVTVEEVGWLKENLATYLFEKRYSDLKTLIDIPSIGIDENLSEYNKSNRLLNIAGDVAFFINGEKAKYWIKINATGKYGENFANFMSNKDFSFQVFTKDGVKHKELQNSAKISADLNNEIKDSFASLLESQFKNIDKNFLNSESTFVDITGKEHKNYYEYLRDTASVTTDLPEGFSYFNSTIYLDTNISDRQGRTVNAGTKEVVQSTKPEVKQTVVPPKEEQVVKTKKKKIDWEKLGNEGLEERYRLSSIAAPTFKVMSEAELAWMQDRFGEEFLSIAKGVDRVISVGGLEAFGYYHNAMIKLAQLAEEGSGYHEAFHFVMLTQLSHSQQESLIAAAKKTYGNKNRLELEEALAEDFRNYMLADGQYEPQVNQARSLFKRILDYVKKALGFKSTIEKMFEKTAAFQVTPDIAKELSLKRDLAPLQEFTDLRHRLVPGFTWSNQQIEALNATTHRLLQKAMDMAGDSEVSYDEILEQPSNVEKFLLEIKSEYELAIKESNKQKTAIEEGGLELSENELRELAARHKVLTAIIDNWENTKEGENLILGYKSKLVQNLSKYGFTVKAIETVTPVSDQTDTAETAQEGSEYLGTDPAAQERVHGVSFLVQNPLKTLSGKIKRFLATIPELGKDKTPALTIFGTPKYVEFNRVYANLSSKLAGYKDVFGRLNDLAKEDPIVAAVKAKLDQHIEKGQLGFDPVVAQFYTAFNKSNYKFFTTLVGFENGVPTARVIETDRRNIEKTLVEDWRSAAVKKNFIDTDGTVNKDRATTLQNTIKELSTKKKDLSYSQMKEELLKLLSAVGITVPEAVWTKLDVTGTRSRDISQMLFGEAAPSFESFIKSAVEGNNPFDGSGLLTELGRRSKDYVEDLQARTFINEKGNQVSAINLNTPITDLISKLTNDQTGTEQIAIYEQDKFYKGNEFLRVLKDAKTKRQVTVNVFSAYRASSNSEAKEYADTTVQDSFISRLTAWFDSNNTTSGYIYLGTLSDKSQQLSIRLPKKSGNAARAFLKDTLRKTVDQEIVRIQRLNAKLQGTEDNKDFSPSKVSSYSKNNKFLYLPELNNIEGLTESLTAGNLDPDKLAEFNVKIEQVIEQFILTEETAFMNKLVSLGLLTKKGEIYLNEGLPEVFDQFGVGRLTKEFFYNDIAWRLEMSKVFHGDLAFYKNAETYFKRGYQLITPGLQGYINPEINSAGKKKTMKRGIIASSIKVNTPHYLTTLAQLIDPSVTFPDIVNALESGKSENRAVQIAIRYRENNKTDAQGYVTIETYRDILISVGQWTNDHEFFFENAWKQGKSIKSAVTFSALSDIEKKAYLQREAEILLQPLKPFTFGERVIKLSDGSSMLLKEQFKESLTPLLPEWANRHTQYRDLLAAMNRDKIDIMSDSEAVKIGAYGITTDLSQPIIAREVPTESMRFPFFIPEKAKKEILAGTQIEKLIVGNIEPTTKYKLPNGKPLTGKELVKEYHELWSDIIKSDYEDFKAMFGLEDNLRVPESKKLDFLKKLQKVLTEELSHRELPENYLDSIAIIKNKLDQPEFLVGLDFPALGGKYEQILTNLFKKYLLTQYVPGDALVNLADFGTPTAEINSELKFITNKGGEIVEAEVGLPGRHIKGLGLRRDTHYDEAGKIKWDTLTPEQQAGLQMVIYRIRTQGKNSMLPVRVAIVLPDSAGSVIMVPGEGTKQGGFDFDVDKSYLMKRTLEKGKVSNTSHNKLFDLHWAILTNKAHAEELLNPLDSLVHDEMIDYLEKKGVVSRAVKNSPFSTVTDMEMEQLAKYSKAMIGVFSKFAVAHATFQSMSDMVTIKVPIEITNSEGYKYDKIGKMRDDKNILISDNHSAQQNSALDAQKDPKLGYLNITTFNAAVLAYMTDLGVNQKLALAFMNQPILRELANEYFKNGDGNMENAADSLKKIYTGLGTLLDNAKKKKLEIITPGNINTGLTSQIDQNLAHQAQILADFKKYYYAAQDMNKVNTALSADTVRDMTSISAVQQYIDTVEHVSSERSNVRIAPQVFELKNSPVKRIAAFYNYGIRAALQFTKQFYPYHSTGFDMVRQQIAKETLSRSGRLKDKDAINAVNQAMGLYMFGEDKVLDATMKKFSPNYDLRWSYFTPSRSMAVHLNTMKEKFPKLQKNVFIQALRNDTLAKKGVTQLVGINNTHGNFNKTNLTNAWTDLMKDPNAEIKLLAYDLVRYAIQTSGFKTTPTGFIDVVPAQFWRDSGLSSYHSSLSQAYVDGAKSVDVPSAAKVVVRHIFASADIVKSVPFRTDKDGNITSTVSHVKVTEKGGTHVTEFEGTSTSSVFDELSEMKWARYAKMFDRKASKWRLYERQKDTRTYREIQPLGESGRYVQFTTNGDEPSNHPAHSGLKTHYLERAGQALTAEVMPDYYAENGLGSRIAYVGDVLTVMKEQEKDVRTSKLIDKLIEAAPKLGGTKVVIDQIEEMGMFDGIANEIYINSQISSPQALRHTVLHEIVHAYSVKALTNPQTQTEMNFKQSIERSYEDAKKHVSEKEYGMKSPEEFLAELASNKSFREKVATKPGLWERIIRAIRRVLGLPDTFDSVLNGFYKVLNDSENLTLKQGEIFYLKTPKQNEMKRLFDRVLKSLEKRTERLFRMGKDYKASEKLLEDLTKLGDKQALIKYVRNVIDETAVLAKDLKATLSAPDAVTSAALRHFTEQLNSYKVLGQIRTYIQQHPQEYSELARENKSILTAIDEVLATIQNMNNDVHEASLNIVANWVKNNTSQELELDYIKGQLRLADRDVSVINRGLDAIINSRDEVLRVIGKQVTNANAKAYRKTEALLKSKWLTVSEKYEEWAKTQGLNVNDMRELNKPLFMPESFNKDSEGARFVAPGSTQYKEIMSHPEGHPLRDYYDLVVGTYITAQSTIPKSLRPGYRVPSIRRSSFEAATEEKGLDKLRTLKEGAVDTFRRTYDETDRQATDEAGNPLDFVPIRFISKQDGKDGRMSIREVSLDVASTSLMFIDEMNKHDALLEIVHDLELAKDVLAKREVALTKRAPGLSGLISSDRQAVVDDDGYVRTQPGVTSNSYLQAKQFIDRMVYGKQKNDEGEVSVLGTRVDVAKSVDALLRYTGIRMMAGNLNVAFSNVATGEVTMLKEAIGGRWFTMKDWAKGKSMFAKEILPYAGELGKRKTESKFGAIFELFNPEDQTRGNLHLGKDNNRLKRVGSFKNLNFANNIGTLELNGTLMLAMMNQVKLTSKDGEVKLYDALEVKDGVVSVKPGLKYKGREFNDSDINNIRNKIIVVGQKMNGIYNVVDSPGIRASSIGRMVLLMRNWLKPGIDARWRLKYFDERLGAHDEGYYLSAIGFFRNMFGEGGWMKENVANLRYIFGIGLNNYDFLTAQEREELSAEEQEDLTNLRRANTKKFLFEVYTIAALSALVMFGWDEDDDKDSIVLYHIVRLKRELMTFFSPTEAWGVLRSPTVALDTIERLAEFTGSVAFGVWTGRAFEDYESGPSKGETRIWAQLQNKVPVWSQRNQFEGLDKKIDLMDRGWK